MNILSIETSCDETAFAIGSINGRNLRLLANVISSQVKIHQKYGGVVPNLCAREHLKNFSPLLETALKQAKLSAKDIDAISVVNGPGLIPALLVGVSIAKTLAYYLQKPLIPVHHIEGHLYSAWLKDNSARLQNILHHDIKFPVLALVVSGGHTQLVLMKKHLDYKVIGQTLDDAAGEAFDKVAKMLKLGYPGGPVISKLARRGNPGKFALPRPMINTRNFNFSFSGLKTAVLYLIKKRQAKKPAAAKQGVKSSQPQASTKFKADVAASFEQAIVETLITKTKKAITKYQPKSLILAGGVAANSKLRAEFRKLKSVNQRKIQVSIPPLKFTGDNAAMQLPVVMFKIKLNSLRKYSKKWGEIEAHANLAL